MDSERTKRHRSRHGFTLLELMLALALTTLLLGAITMAVDLHLRALDSRRSMLEESQLARAVLRIVADDIRGVVLPYEQDISTIESLMSGSAQAALDQAGGVGGDITGPDVPEGGDGGSGDMGMDPAGDAGLGDATGLGSEDEVSENTVDLASGTTLPAQPGIYGNQYELQLDISRLPRIDELQAAYSTSSDALMEMDVPSDVKTVTYYVMSDQTGYASSGLEQGLSLADERDPSIVGRGLVRRQLDRAVTQWAMTNGTTAGVVNAGEVLAPEVIGIEFAYFDGLEWRTEWDSETEGGSPMAIQIILAIASDGAAGMPAATDLAGGIQVTTEGNVRYYHVVVHVPTAIPLEETSDMTTM
jgi:prepilin-type N-terminal cleavage/methylation domain-containing protein